MSQKYSPLLELTLTRLREFYREPAALFWVYGFPLLLALGLGYAFANRPVEAIAVDIVTDSSEGLYAAEALMAKLQADPRLKVKLSDTTTATERLRIGKTGLVITPCVGSPGWDYTIDPNRPESVLAKAASENALLRSMNPNLPMPETREYKDKGGRYIDFLFPGLIGANLMGGGLFGVGFVVVDMRVRKLLKRFLATPMNRRDFLFSLMLSRFFFTVVEIGVLLFAAWLFFGITIRGPFAALLIVIVFAALAFTGIGLLVASRAKTIETVSGLMNAIMLPMYITSGVFFSTNVFPDEIQPFLNIIPLTAVNNALRLVINEGAGLERLWAPLLIMAGWGITSFVFALRIFRWK
ncbi:MAG: ABC transporter permease [Fimbriiglobus sp.]